MDINRHNYEEYFILYTDNELNAADCKAVEQFVKENPDLERELLLFTQASLMPDNDIAFDNKHQLMRSPGSLIHEENCEQLFILYADDELTNDQKADVEQFVYDNPQYQESFELMQSLKLSPDASIVFPDKKSLYRREKTEKPVVFAWWRVAAAAVILLFGGILWFNNSSTSKPSNGVVNAGKDRAGEKPGVSQGSSLAKTVQEAPILKEGNVDDSIAPSSKSPALATNTVIEKKVAKNSKRKDIAQKAVVNTANDKTPTPVVEKATNELRGSANTQLIDIAKNENQDRAVASNGISQSEKNDKKIVDLAATTTDPYSAANAANQVAFASSASSDNENVILANILVDKKNSLRGIIRKASRIIEKTTSFRSEKRSGLAIGNIQIAFQ